VRALAGCLAAALAIGALAPAALGQNEQPRTNLADIEDEVMCPVCGTTLELAEAPQAERERELIRRLIDRGLSKEEVKQALVAEYGEDVLSTPEASGFDLSAWLVPGLGLAAAAIAIAVGLSRTRRRRDSGDGPGGDISAEDSRRLDAELSAYDG
jgi:cytochrome c-type biogenesis protein CcmH